METWLPQTIIGLLGILVSLYVAKRVQDVHVSINSRMDELLKQTHSASYAEGVKSEVDKQNQKGG